MITIYKLEMIVYPYLKNFDFYRKLFKIVLDIIDRL